MTCRKNRHQGSNNRRKFGYRRSFVCFLPSFAFSTSSETPDTNLAMPSGNLLEAEAIPSVKKKKSWQSGLFQEPLWQRRYARWLSWKCIAQCRDEYDDMDSDQSRCWSPQAHSRTWTAVSGGGELSRSDLAMLHCSTIRSARPEQHSALGAAFICCPRTGDVLKCR